MKIEMLKNDIYIYIYIYPPLYFRLICYSKPKMQKHRVPAFRLFFLAGSRGAQEGICYCFWLPSTAQPARLKGWGPLPPRYRWPPKCGLKLVPSKSCFRSSQDAQMVANLLQKAPLRRRLKPTDTIVNWYQPQISKCKIHTIYYVSGT